MMLVSRQLFSDFVFFVSFNKKLNLLILSFLADLFEALF